MADTKEKAPKEPTLAEQLQAIDYKNMTGEPFKAYVELENSLKLNDNYTFDVFQAESVYQERYPGMPGTPKDLVGIRIKNDTPIHFTSIPVRHAKEMNAQLNNTNRYYLLKK